MPEELRRSAAFRGARFVQCRLDGVVIRDCDVTGLQIVDSLVHDVSVSGDLRHVVVNDVDVTAYVEGELDRRHPERVLVREAETPDACRRLWPHVAELWAGTLRRARQLPEALLQQRVGDEWSFVETQRHLLFCSDAWVGSAVLEEDRPYHPLGYPDSGYPPEKAAELGLTLDARPTLDEVLRAREARAAVVGRVIAELDDDGFRRICGRRPSPEYPDQEYTVGRCLRVVLREEIEHRRYTERDLVALDHR